MNLSITQLPPLLLTPPSPGPFSTISEFLHHPRFLPPHLPHPHAPTPSQWAPTPLTDLSGNDVRAKGYPETEGELVVAVVVMMVVMMLMVGRGGEGWGRLKAKRAVVKKLKQIQCVWGTIGHKVSPFSGDILVVSVV